MDDYNTLIERLRESAEFGECFCKTGCCGKRDNTECVFVAAADAIEDLQKQLMDLKMQKCSCFK